MIVLLTPPDLSPQRAPILNRLFEKGLYLLHLRLPQASEEAYASILDQIAPWFRNRVILCDHYHLAHRYSVGGFYLSFSKIKDGRGPNTLPALHPSQRIAVGAHSIEELQGLAFVPSYALLSPVFDSVSKKGYKANPSLLHSKDQLALLPFPVLAMGGVSTDRQKECLRAGFSGVALLGCIWQKEGQEELALSSFYEPEIISIAGHDPSGGAGITADLQVAANFGVRCFTIPTTLTTQTEQTFHNTKPVDIDYVRTNIKLILTEHPNIKVAKIGLITSLKDLLTVVITLRQLGVMYIIWDPVTVVSASDTQVLRLEEETMPLWQKILRNIDLITPNYEEAVYWFGAGDSDTLAQASQENNCKILLKGGHRQGGELSSDVLFSPDQEPITFSVPRDGYPKHGTGCMLSAAIAALYARGETIYEACKEAQRYVSLVMQKRKGLLTPVVVGATIEDKLSEIRQKSTLQYITNEQDSRQLLLHCDKALQGGIRWIQLRLKNASTEERVTIALRLKQMCCMYGATLIIDDDVEAVLKSNAHGVHIGINDMPLPQVRRILGEHSIIGYTCHNEDDLFLAHRFGADYIGVGPYRFTSTKKNLSALLGLEGITSLVKINQQQPHPIPSVAIGGIAAEDFPNVALTGVNGVALSGAIEQATDITKQSKKLLQLLRKYFI